MELWLMRHGIAEEQARGGDAARELTPEGVEKSVEMARALRTLDAAPDVVFSSTLVRAVQTAAAVTRTLKLPEAERWEELAPSADPAETIRALRSVKGAERVCLVGHDPHMSRFSSLLLAGSPAVQVQFKKSALMAIAFDGHPAAGRGTLIGFLPPGWARRLRAV